jgi:hypothetical protein
MRDDIVDQIVDTIGEQRDLLLEMTDDLGKQAELNERVVNTLEDMEERITDLENESEAETFEKPDDGANVP